MSHQPLPIKPPVSTATLCQKFVCSARYTALASSLVGLGITPALAANANQPWQLPAKAVQQQGYQMLTPDQIERELAAINKLNNSTQNRRVNTRDVANFDADFDAPIATLKSNQPIGFDSILDAEALPTPTNFSTLNDANADVFKNDVFETEMLKNEAAETHALKADIFEQHDLPASATTASHTPTPETTIINPNSALNPDDYLPDYEMATETDRIVNTTVATDKPRAAGNVINRLYSKLFNGGVMPLPYVKTTVYLQQSTDSTDATTPPLIKADDSNQPISNIKAALDDTTLQSVVDFTAALPRLTQTALDAAKAVGYYDVRLRLNQPSRDRIDVIIESLGKPVRVDSRVIDIRGEGRKQAEYQTFESTLPPQEGDIFNHQVYKNSKTALESLSSTYGYFDQNWLNKSVDIILPDNLADISLIYDTGTRYQFDDVVFFTYDKETGTLTRDPNKLPVEPALLQQMIGFEAGSPFYYPDVTKLGNNLSATRYFNTVNVESILPPDERSQEATLAFDNLPFSNDNILPDTDAWAVNTLNDGNHDDSLDNGSLNATNDGLSTNNGTAIDADIAPIEFDIDEETQEKLLTIKQKAERLSGLPSNRVLDEKPQKVDNLLGKISNSISHIARQILPDDERSIPDENFVPPTLEGRISPEQVQASKKVPLYVFVSADKPRDAQIGIGYGTDTGVRATSKIDYNLINRQGHQAGAEIEVSRINKNLTVYGTRPWKHPLNDKLQTRLTYKEETIDQGKGNFDLSTKTLEAALSRNIVNEAGWDKSYFVNYRLDELETGLAAADLDDLPVRFISSKPKQKALLLGYGISKSQVDNAINPARGFRQYYSVEAGGDKALSDTDMAIIHAGVSGLYSFGANNKHQVLAGFNGGYIWADNFEDVPYKLRFFAGGDQSIRGYDYDSLSPLENGYLTGGQILAVGSAEYNYEFTSGFRGAVFADVGNAYDKDFDTDTKIGVGVGVRWASPVGVVRIDVAAGVTEESIPVRLHFFIGSPL